MWMDLDGRHPSNLGCVVVYLLRVEASPSKRGCFDKAVGGGSSQIYPRLCAHRGMSSILDGSLLSVFENEYHMINLSIMLLGIVKTSPLESSSSSEVRTPF